MTLRNLDTPVFAATVTIPWTLSSFISFQPSIIYCLMQHYHSAVPFSTALPCAVLTITSRSKWHFQLSQVNWRSKLSVIIPAASPSVLAFPALSFSEYSGWLWDSRRTHCGGVFFLRSHWTRLLRPDMSSAFRWLRFVTLSLYMYRWLRDPRNGIKRVAVHIHHWWKQVRYRSKSMSDKSHCKLKMEENKVGSDIPASAWPYNKLGMIKNAVKFEYIRTIYHSAWAKTKQ